MKKIIILFSLVILVTSCGAKKEPTVKEIDAAVQKSMETQDISKPVIEDTETGITPSTDTGVTDEPVEEEPIKVEPKPVEIIPPKVEVPKPKPVVVTPPPVVVTPPTPKPVVVTPPKTTITKIEVANHNTKSDCYTIIDAKVYNITSFFGKHPGGDEKIIGLCGVDGSSKFNSVHGESEKANITKDKYFKANLGN